MKTELTVSDSATGRLILIFAGWGTDPDFYRHIRVEGYDVMVVWDYRDLSFPMEIFDSYHTVCLFAWSLGVAAAARVLPFSRLAMAVAVNGTELPVSDRFGIPEAIFNGTASGLNDRSLLKFRKRMAGKLFSSVDGRFPSTSPEILADELRSVANLTPLPSPLSTFPSSRWDRAYISAEDAIFPPGNMKTFWNSLSQETEVIDLPGPHFVDLESVVRTCVPEVSVIGRRFSKAIPSYSENAGPQTTVAVRLTDMLPTSRFTDVVEIGPGNGLFSHMWTSKLIPEKVTYVDLYPVSLFGLAAEEKTVCSDAEDWMAREASENPAVRDAVVSSSAIQWFANPGRFFRNAAMVLREGGLLAFSTFLPGNLDQLRSANPFPLLYRHRESIVRMLQPWFSIDRIEEGEIELRFESARQTLAHLGRTGAGGSFTPPETAFQLGSVPTRLTYRPLWVTARRNNAKPPF